MTNDSDDIGMGGVDGGGGVNVGVRAGSLVGAGQNNGEEKLTLFGRCNH